MSQQCALIREGVRVTELIALSPAESLLQPVPEATASLFRLQARGPLARRHPYSLRPKAWFLLRSQHQLATHRRVAFACAVGFVAAFGEAAWAKTLVENKSAISTPMKGGGQQAGIPPSLTDGGGKSGTFSSRQG